MTRRRSRAIVTGGAGFIGSHLVDRLLADGWEVLVVDDLSTGSLDNLSAAAQLEQRDLADGELDHLFRDWRPRVVFHLAAQASVPASLSDPLRDLAVNVVGTHRVAAAAGAAGADRIVFVSSGGAVYGETRRAATELQRPAPRSYYGVHKLAAEGHLALAGLAYAIARPSNVYGPRQMAGNEGAVVAAFLDQARRGGGLRIHGDGMQTRDLVHVRDAVDALVLLGRKETAIGIWNVAAGRPVTVNRLAAIVEEAVGRPLERSYGPRRSGDVTHSAVSATRLRGLGWRPTINLRDGIHNLSAESASRPRLASPGS